MFWPTTTDPAGNVLDSANEFPDKLEVARIDPEVEVAKYTEAALKKAASAMDTDGLALLKEDLRSPCTEEIAVFRAFAQAVAQKVRTGSWSSTPHRPGTQSC